MVSQTILARAHSSASNGVCVAQHHFNCAHPPTISRWGASVVQPGCARRLLPRPSSGVGSFLQVSEKNPGSKKATPGVIDDYVLARGQLAIQIAISGFSKSTLRLVDRSEMDLCLQAGDGQECPVDTYRCAHSTHIASK